MPMSSQRRSSTSTTTTFGVPPRAGSGAPPHAELESTTIVAVTPVQNRLEPRAALFTVTPVGEGA